MADRVTYSIANDWGAGFIGSLDILADANGLNGWTVTFDAGFQISNLWGAEIVSHVGSRYTLRNLSWNAALPANGTTSIGFQAAGGNAAHAVSTLALNGQVQGTTPPAPAPVTASIADAALLEGASGTHDMVFTVSLSGPAKTAVTMGYATANGTAVSGQDYVAAQGTLSFAAGETTKTIRVAVKGDTMVEANEAFTLRLADLKGATLSDGVASGTIRNDDAAPPPGIRVGDASIAEGNPAKPGSGTGAPGFFSTEGSQIVDATGQVVKIAGVNWFGLESTNFAPHGLWARGYKEMMQEMVELGFNTIRLPFSSELLHTGAAPNGIDFAKNPDLAGLSAMQVMDRIVDYAGEIGLRIILDHHRNSAGAGTSGNGLWYEGSYTEAKWIADWKMLAARYAGDPAVIGADLHNEPYNGSWGDGSATDWQAAAERAGNAVLASNPDWLIFVEGISNYKGNSYWWGGNLMGVRDHPVELNIDGKLVYSAHDYPNSIYGQPWFQGSNFAEALPAKFDQMWGYIFKEGIAPVYLGEFGSKLQDPKDIAWLEKLTDYLSGDFNTDGRIDLAAGQEGPGWTWWSWNPNSGDTGGILADDWTTVNTRKVDYLEPLQFDLGEGGAGTPADRHVLSFKVTLSAPATSAVTVNYATANGTATAGDFTPTSGTLVFAPGEVSKIITVPVTADAVAEASETMVLRLSNPKGATLADGTGTGTITNDDVAVASVTAVRAVPPTAAPAGLEGSVTIVDSWARGFSATVKLHNDGPSALSGWQLEIAMPNEITQIWNAEIVSRTGEGYVIRNAAWNGGLAEDAEASFGFLGSGTANATAMDLVF
jgi:aryl-phospho-beta-D-glucosidase BglC (GH1 family)